MASKETLATMTGVITPLLTVNLADRDAVDLASLWLPRPWKKTTLFAIDEYELDPLSEPGTLGPERRWEIGKQGGSFIRDLCFHTVWPAHTIALPAISAGYVDYLGYAMFDHSKITFGSNLLYERQMYDNYFYYIKAFRDEEKFAIDYLVRGNQSAAARAADLVNGVETWTDMFFPFEMADSHSLPIVALSQKLDVTLKTRPLQEIVVTNPVGNSPSVTPNAPYRFTLRVRSVNTANPDADAIVAMTKREKGVAYLIGQNVHSHHELILGNNTASFQARVSLQSMTKPLRYLMWSMIPDNLVNNTGTNDFFFFQPNPTLGPVPPGMGTYLPIIRFGITAGQMEIQRPIQRDYSRIRNHYKYFPSRAGEEIFHQTYAEFPLAVNAATGFMDYTTLGIPYLTVDFAAGGTGTVPAGFPGAGGAQNLRVILNAMDYNFWFFKWGNANKSFH